LAWGNEVVDAAGAVRPSAAFQVIHVPAERAIDEDVTGLRALTSGYIEGLAIPSLKPLSNDIEQP
jgi:hypothetical protein